MAGDWIKMRVNLVTHPKVLAISEILAGNEKYQDWSTMAGFVPSIGGTKDESERDFQDSLRVTRYVTVCALLRFWGYANEHAREEFISTLRVSDLDDIVQVPGFGEALELIGWAEYDSKRKGLLLPNFNEYNTSGNDRSASAKSQAQRQKEYRDRKKLQESDVTRDVTVTVTSDRREEKRREEKINTVGSAKRRTQMPLDFFPDETGLKSAADKGVRVDVELPKFKDFHTGKGSVMLDWQAAWRTWCSNAKQFAPRFTPDPIAVTVPSRPGVDPALAKCIADSLVCKGPPPNIRSRMKQLQGARP